MAMHLTNKQKLNCWLAAALVAIPTKINSKTDNTSIYTPYFCVFVYQQHSFKCLLLQNRSNALVSHVTIDISCSVSSYVRMPLSSPATYLIIRNYSKPFCICASLCVNRSFSLMRTFAGVSITSFNIGIIRLHCITFACVF